MSSSDVITLNFSQPDFTATNGTQYKTIIGLGNKVNNIGNLVVWAEITPSASSQLQWSNNVFGVYATTVKNDQMNLVFVNSQEPASLGSSFSWNGSYFDTYGNNSDPYSISITNKSQSNWTLGLTVQNSNNANIPINAATVIPNQTISIKAPDTLYIRFGHDYDLLNIITNYGTDYFQQFNIVPGTTNLTFDPSHSVWKAN